MKYRLARTMSVIVVAITFISQSTICLGNKIDLSSPEAAYRTSIRCVQQGLAEDYWETMTDSGRLRYGRTKTEQVAKLKAQFEYANKDPGVSTLKDIDVDITDTVYSKDRKAGLVVAENMYKGKRTSSEASVIMILEGSSWKVLRARASGNLKSREEFKNKSSDDVIVEFNKFNEALKKLSAEMAAQSSTRNTATSNQIEAGKSKTNVVKTGSVVTVGVPNSSSFAQSLKKAGDFFEPYHQAREKIIAGDYETAISLLNESLKYAWARTDYAMAYRFLIGIYGDLGDLENELKSIELFTKSTMNEDEMKRFQKKAEDIQAALEKKRAPIAMVDRYPVKAVYGGPRFNSYREILLAQEQSSSLREQGDQAVKDGRFEDAIRYYCVSYVPEGWDNESSKTGLVKAYAQAGRYADALEVLDDTRTQFKVLGSEEPLNGKVRTKLLQAIQEGKLALVGDTEKFPEEIYLGAKLKPPAPKDFRGDPINRAASSDRRK